MTWLYVILIIIGWWMTGVPGYLMHRRHERTNAGWQVSDRRFALGFALSIPLFYTIAMLLMELDKWQEAHPGHEPARW